MSNLYSLISFLAFFVLCIICLDFFLPRKNVVCRYSFSTSSNKQQLVIKEYTPILKQTIYITRNGQDGIAREIRMSFFYFPGVVFIFFLVIGSVYGVFFKKPAYLERRAAYYNLFVCFLLLSSFLYSISQ